MKAGKQAFSHPNYRPDIDGLRAVAVLAVVGFHAFPAWVTGGFIGVDIFFVISGYLISTIIFENLEKNTFSFKEFYSRRIKRIFPALILVLTVAFIFGWFVLLADEYKQLGSHIASGAIFISNFTLWSEAGYFDNSADSKPLLHLWSLGIEEQFYIIWPLLLWLAWRSNFNLLLITVIIAISSFILNMKGIEHDINATFYSPQTRIWELLSGSVLAWATLYKKNKLINFENRVDAVFTSITLRMKCEVRSKILPNILSVIGFLLLVYGFWRINKDLNFPGKWAILPVAGAIFILMAGSKAWINSVILSNKVLIWFGLISFPLYLWHWPILSFARIVEGDVLSWDIRILAIFFSIALAWLTYKFIERPIRTGGKSKLSVILLVALMSIIGLFGYIVFKNDGLAFRTKFYSTSSSFISQLAKISDVYEFYNYNGVLRAGLCHSVSLDNFKKNKCIDVRKNNIFIWGDSYAASLYAGLNYVRDNGYQNIGITQMTDGKGPPFYKPGKTDDGKLLVEANNNRLAIVKEISPQIIILNWMVGGGGIGTKEESVLEINKTIDKILLASPTSKIIIIGPFPRWQETLRKQLLENFKKTKKMPPVYMSQGLVPLDKEFDLFFKEKIKRSSVEYISAYDIMCNTSGCLTRVGDNASDITAVDWGHLTNAGSIYLADKIKNKIFGF